MTIRDWKQVSCLFMKTKNLLLVESLYLEGEKLVNFKKVAPFEI